MNIDLRAILLRAKKRKLSNYKGKRKPEVSTDVKEDFLKKGYRFEQLVVSLFDTQYFTLLEWRSDKSVDGIFPVSCQFPDLEFYFETESDSLHFAVECKWREHFENDKMEWATEGQINNYWEFQHVTEIPVFIVIGIGGEPNRPKAMYIFTLEDIEGPVLYEMKLSPYQRKSTHDLFTLNTSVPHLR